MPIAPGTRLGPYEIASLLGTGGFGEVYRAQDTRLGRTVAVKILPNADPELRNRFEREAKAIAALQHRHICTLHDVGHHEGTDYLVMEFLDGETLAARISRGRLKVDEALAIGDQIAEALEAAHRAGIVHRDLKPANVMLTKSGVKLLDFGLAKLRPAPIVSGVSVAPTITTPPMTAQGTILGTLQYMAPEQLEGLEVDARADVWAFGCILHEMVSGKPPFEGRSQAGLMAAILERDPVPLDMTDGSITAEFDRLVRLCLAKDRDARRQTIADVRHDLHWIREQGPVLAAGASGSIAPHRGRGTLGWVVAGAAGAAAITLAVMLVRSAADAVPPTALRRFEIAPPPLPSDMMSESNPTEGLAGRRSLAISPAGERVALAFYRRLYLRELEQLEPVAVKGLDVTSNAPRDPFFSPDGRWLAYWQSGQLRKMAVSGGADVKICDVDSSWGATWASDGTIVFGWGAKGIWKVSAQGGAPEQVLAVDAARNEAARQPQWLPGGKAILYSVASNSQWAQARVVVRSVDGSPAVTIAENATDGRYLPSGHITFVQRGTLIAVAFDATTLQIQDGPVALQETVRAGLLSVGSAEYDVSGNGTLVHVSRGSDSSQRAIVSVDRSGRELPVDVSPREWGTPRWSPDGNRLALGATEGGNTDIVVADVRRGTTSRLTFEAASDDRPVWSPDAKWLYFRSDQEGPGIYRKSSDGIGLSEKVTTVEGDGGPLGFTPDGTLLLFSKVLPSSGRDVWGIDLATRSAKPLISDPGNQGNATVSPNGRWIAYDNGGQILVRPFPNVGDGRWQVVAEGAKWPVWSRDERELFYASGSALYAASVDTSGPAFRSGAGKKLWEGAYAGFGGLTGARAYDLSPDGTRFVLLKPLAGDDRHIVVVENWFDELKRRLPNKPH